MNVPAGWAVLDFGPTKSLSGAEPAILSAQRCEKKGRGAGDDRKAEAVDGRYQIRGISEQVITSFIYCKCLEHWEEKTYTAHRASVKAARLHMLETTI